MPLTLGGTAEKRKPSSGKLAKPGHMLADRDVGAEQPGVHRPRPHMHIVDIAAVDPDQHRAVLGQPIGGGGGQVGMLAEISVAAPMAVPAGVDEHRFAPNFAPVESGGSIARPFSHGRRMTIPAGRPAIAA